jgi:cobalamin biosynthesis protein CobD/CbiB
MGTGRWIEETCDAYSLGEVARKENIRLKFRVIPGMLVCFLLVLATGAFGAIADPASTTDVAHAVTIHFTLAVTLLAVNSLVSWIQYRCIARNGDIVDEIVAEVRRIRQERGMEPAPQPTAQ